RACGGRPVRPAGGAIPQPGTASGGCDNVPPDPRRARSPGHHPPMISVVIPVHRLTYLAEAIGSVLGQDTDLLDELLLVTDALSIEDLGPTHDLLDDARVRVLATGASTPSPAARKWNLGLKATTSD